MDSWNAPYINNYYKYITTEIESLQKSPQIGEIHSAGNFLEE
jgi:hypothetical protein